MYVHAEDVTMECIAVLAETVDLIEDQGVGIVVLPSTASQSSLLGFRDSILERLSQVYR